MFNSLRLLLPALIPSWRFFDVIASSPRIEYAQLRTSDEVADEGVEEAGGDWRAYRPRPQSVSRLSMLTRLVWNPRWNEALFVASCAERLTSEPTEHSQDEIFRRIAADLTDRQTPGGTWLRFRIVMLSEVEGVITRDVAFVSDTRRLASIAVR